jgi:hypothetical protein
MCRIIDDGHQARVLASQFDEALHLVTAHHRRRDQQSGNTGRGEGFGFADGGRAYSDGSGLDLPLCDLGAFVRFGVRPQVHPGRFQVCRHLAKIGLKYVQIQHQRRGRKLVFQQGDGGLT